MVDRLTKIKELPIRQAGKANELGFQVQVFAVPGITWLKSSSTGRSSRSVPMNVS